MKSLIAILLVTLLFQTIPQPTFLPLISHQPPPTLTPTVTSTSTPLPTATATATPSPTPTLFPLNPLPELVAIRPYDVPPGMTIDQDEGDEESPDIQYAAGWVSWYSNDTIGFGSRVRKYWTPDAALAGYQRILNFIFGNDFYDSCATGTRAVPVIPGADAYAAIQCRKGTYHRTNYIVAYDNIVLTFEFAATYRAPDAALACEKLMAQRALGQTEDFECRTYFPATAE